MIVREKAILVQPDFGGISSEELMAKASELEALAASTDLEVLKVLAFRQKSPNAGLLIGKGRASEIRDLVASYRAQVVIFGADLSPSHERNLEKLFGVKAIDRTQLILDIFARRARSAEGKLQVELAQLEYLYPRLAGKGTELSRQGGGIGTRGPGEQKLEVDRRRIRERIKLLKNQFQTMQNRRLDNIQRKKDKDWPLAAIVGYTNAGKSSLFNLLTHSDVLVRDKLFATLDTTTRMLTVNPNQKALLADTVGFIRDLPHDLVEAFKATLEETMHADLLIHVVDAAAEDYRVKEQAVEQVLEQLGAGSKPTLKVYNKTDLLTDAAKATLSTFERGLGVYFISVLKRQGIEELLEGISERFAGEWIRWDILVPASKQNLINYLYEKALVLARRDEADGSHLSVSIRPQDKRVIESKLQG